MARSKSELVARSVADVVEAFGGSSEWFGDEAHVEFSIFEVRGDRTGEVLEAVQRTVECEGWSMSSVMGSNEDEGLQVELTPRDQLYAGPFFEAL